jgi:hypothetical protein
MNLRALLIRTSIAAALALTVVMTVKVAWIFAPHPNVIVILQAGSSTTALSLDSGRDVRGGPVRGAGFRTFAVSGDAELRGSCLATPAAQPREIDIAYVDMSWRSFLVVVLDDCRITRRWYVL